MWVDLPLGDVADRMTILDLKAARLADPDAAGECRDRRTELGRAWADAGLPPPAEVPGWHSLATVNAELWDVEDALRAHEARADFGDTFVALARRVYVLNDRRSALKRGIDDALGSRWREWKSHGSAAKNRDQALTRRDAGAG